ncbi:YdcF family protein [Shewanella sp. NIFS-20-20]|uniref:YdcF family protein n=1 Tax=Shewanella sp. NIFS-20-20 TaxID=2853806 RepID=UPI001C45F340|nr:ElyC/SanA/YdcF family protein [Shewanella sp. NIFS-20-20]MBV7314852.1 YdcF family protein [Shewanella sp. NIFS-20-20]
MFVLKKIISQFMMPIPLTLLLLCLVAWMLRHRRGHWRWPLLLAVSLLVFVSSNFGSRLLLEPLEQQYAYQQQPIVNDCVVMVLGSGHDDHLAVSALQQLSPTAMMRLQEGLRQTRFGQNCLLITSGFAGSNNQRAHSDVMADAATELGFPRERIISLPLAKDTIEEAQYLRWEINQTPFRLVTSASHMPRAMAIFEQIGTQPQAAPADYMARQGVWWALSADNLLGSQRAIHEYIGQSWWWIKSHW